MTGTSLWPGSDFQFLAMLGLAIEDFDEIHAQIPVFAAALIPLADYQRSRGIEMSDIVEPVDASIYRAFARSRMIPGNVACQATHGHGFGEATVNQQRAFFLK
jgi:hypothetical protein